MSKPPRTLTMRLDELRPVVDAVELTKGLRGRIVGGKKRFARLFSTDGGMTVELFGSSTFVPIAIGALDHELSVDANLLAGFLRNCTRAFHPAEIVGLNVGPDHLILTCGTLRVSLQLGAVPSSPRQASRSTAARTATKLRPPEPKSEGDHTEDIEGIAEPSAAPTKETESNQIPSSFTGPTDADLRLGDAEDELDQIEEIERTLTSEKRQRPDYKGLSLLVVGCFLILAIVDLVVGGIHLAWLVLVCSVIFFLEAWSDFSAKYEWEKKRGKKEKEISEVQKRIDLLGYTARQEPSRWVLKLKSKKNAPDA